MFHGSIPSEVQKIVGEIASGWKAEKIYVGCSGNFTIERLLSFATDAKLYGNDVTVYSCLIGDYLVGKKLEARYNPEYRGPMEFVEKYLTDDASIIAVVMLLSKMAQALRAKKKNPYYDRMIKAYKDQWDTLFDATRKVVEDTPKILADFYRGDVCEWIKTLDHGEGFICYPPFFSGDYEKMFLAIEDIILWNPPEYEMLDKDKISALFQEITKFSYFIFGTNDYIEEYKDYLIGLAQTTNRGTPLYVYSNCDKSRIVMPRQRAVSPLFPRLGEQEDVGDNISLVKLKTEEFQALRSHYMNVHINPGSESIAIGVVVDGKLIGVYALSVSPTHANWDKHVETPTVYLLSDFPVAPSKYKRLAKLVLYGALSKEAKLIAETTSNRRANTLITTAFSKKPVSMKYRGLFDLVAKRELEGVSEQETDMSKVYYGSGYALNYASPLGRWTLQEGLELWKKKHSQAWSDEGVAEK